MNESDGAPCSYADVERATCELGACLPAACGNGRLDPSELCDDGNRLDGDGCAAGCQSDEWCGNGVVDVHLGEECDCGVGEDDRPAHCTTVNGAAGATCNALCVLRYCGNGIVDPGELCDDGNWLAGDGCAPDCRSDEQCGNGVVDVHMGEGCDDGNSQADDGCSANCRLESCGNGHLDPGEVCDDGNNLHADGCAPSCLSTEICGNAVADLATGEQCDCGNDNALLPVFCAANNGHPDSRCDAECRLRFCGNGSVDANEVCDDGNLVAGDGCSPDCLSDETCGNGRLDAAVGESCDCGQDPSRLPAGCGAPNGESDSPCTATCGARFCGNGEVDPWEACDDNNTMGGDGCRADCLSDETCGNGQTDLQAGETCDCGSDPSRLPPGCAAVNGAPGSICSVACHQRYCGNGVLDPGEICDDGNRVSGDGCAGSCLSDEICGNAIVDFAAGEQCDDGNLLAGDGCDAQCQAEFCGNGVLNVGETCDDGNNVSGDGCSPNCQSNEVCGNGQVDPAVGEQCDDGNTVPGDGCSDSCVLEYCGNGVQDPGEACDDGNNVPGDGCRQDCLSDESCGNGIVDHGTGEQCDDGNLVAGDGCSSACHLEVCGNGFLDPGETCDDGNNVYGDGCDGSCMTEYVVYRDPVAEGHILVYDGSKDPAFDEYAAVVTLPFPFPFWDNPTGTSTTTLVSFGVNGGLVLGYGLLQCCNQYPLWTYDDGHATATVHVHGADSIVETPARMYQSVTSDLVVFTWVNMDYHASGADGDWSAQLILYPSGNFSIYQISASTEPSRLVSIGLSDGLAANNAAAGATNLDWDTLGLDAPFSVGQVDFGSTEPGGMATGRYLLFEYDPVAGYTCTVRQQ